MARRLGVRTRRTGHSRRFNTKTDNTILVNQNALMGPAGGPSPPQARHGRPGLPRGGGPGPGGLAARLLTKLASQFDYTSS